LKKLIYNRDQIHKGPRARFKIVNEKGVEFIEEVSLEDHNSEVTDNNLISYKGINKMPYSPADNIYDSPKVALANLDWNNSDEIILFVNTWGLLGLRNVTVYEKKTHEQRKGIPYISLFKAFGRRREPLELFKDAVKDFQTLLNYKNLWETNKDTTIKYKGSVTSIHSVIKQMLGDVIDDAKPKLTYNGNSFEISLFNNSLLGFVYLDTALDLDRGIGLKICSRENCKKYFEPNRLDNKYCSDLCTYAVRQKNKRIRDKAIKELIQEYPTILKGEIERFVKDSALKKHLSLKEIKELFYNNYKERK
jgi:hypothetical protein